MNTLLSLSIWLTLMMSSCCGDAGSHEKETTTAEYDDFLSETPTPDYDYTATFDYYFVTGPYYSDVHNKASGIGRLGPVLLLGLAVHQIWT